jgi:cyclase
MSMDRRQFLATTSAAFVASAFRTRTSSAQGAAPQTPATAFTPLRRNVGIFTGQGGTIGWMVDDKGAVVIDAQFPATARVCLEGIEERAKGRTIDYLVNTHHHGDHTAGNPVFRPAVRRILAHVNVPKLQKEAAERAAKANPSASATEQVYADTTYQNTWREQVGGEVMSLRHYGPAHTGGDSIVFFEKANVIHMGDLVFNRAHPYIDRPAGASIANWMKTLDTLRTEHAKDTIYIFGHAGQKFGVTGPSGDLAYMKDYLSALLEFVRGQMKAGKSRAEIIAITEPLKGFPDHGPLIARVLTAAYDELAG